MGMSLFGPLFRYELARLARRGAQPKFRAAFAALLLIALFLAYLAAFPGTTPLQLLTDLNQPLSIDAGSRFGESFVSAFLLIQIVIVLLVTPAITAGAIGEDKDRGALELLLTTSLTSTEIVVGKLAARLVFVGSLLLTGLPVVTLVTFFGGVDIGQLAAGYAIALFSVLSLGAVSLFLSVMTKTLGSAILRAYMFVLICSLFGIMCACFYYPAFASPIAVTWVLLNGWPRFIAPTGPADPVELVGAYAAVHSVIAALFIALSVRRVRYAGAAPIPTPPKRPRPSVRRYEERPNLLSERHEPRERVNSPPRIGDSNPLLWKERHFGGFFPELPSLFGFPGVLMMGGLLMLAFCCCLSRFGVMLGFVGSVLVVGVGTAASVARERQRGTLESLLTLPVERRDLLWAKLRMGLISGGWVALVSLLVGLVGVPMSSVTIPSLLMASIVFAGWMLAAGGYGLWLSVGCPTVERAVGYWLVTAVLLCILPPLLWPLISASFTPASIPITAVSIMQGLSPVLGIANTLQSPDHWDPPAFSGANLAALLMGLVGVVFGWLAVRRFERNLDMK